MNIARCALCGFRVGYGHSTDCPSRAEAKVAWNLVPFDALEGVPAVCAYGNRKHARDNWRQGASWLTYFAKVLRHLFAWRFGQRVDPDSGLHPLDHALVDLMILRWYAEHRAEFDDRNNAPRGPTPYSGD